jgi:ligand-binding sensor domain-containing protein
MKTPRNRLVSCFASLVVASSLLGVADVCAANAAVGELPFPLVTRFENFGEKDGLPAHKIHSVLKTSDGRLWLGTANGLCVRERDGRFHSYGRADGLSHPTVLAIAEHPVTGDLWLATMQGLCCFSGGKFTTFTQTNSGLPNNVVYAVAIAGDTVWAATAAGAGAYDTKSKSWKIYDQNNTVMEEPWCYAIAPAEKVIYLGVWAGGVVEHDPKTGSFKAYRDPDGDFQLQLMPDSGPVADITSWIAYDSGIIWQGTYFGLSRYDTRQATWKTWVQDKTPLVSNFINSVFAHRRVAWVSTDRGVSVTDGADWADYSVDDQGRGILRTHRPGREPETRTMTTALADGFVMAVWVDEHEAWFATSNGLSRGTFAEPAVAVAVAAQPLPSP